MKYFGETGGPGTVHREPIAWPGTEQGFPLLGSPTGLVKDAEFRDTPLHLYYRAERFRLWMEEDHRRFVDIMDRVVNGQFKLYKRDDHWIPEQEHYIVCLEWAQIYGVPKQRNTANVSASASSAPKPQLAGHIPNTAPDGAMV